MSNNSHGYKISYNGNKLIKIDQYSKTTHKKTLRYWLSKWCTFIYAIRRPILLEVSNKL